MKLELLKYKDHLLLLLALIVANYIIIPLSDWQVSQQQGVSLLTKKQIKTQALLENTVEFDKFLLESISQLQQLESFVFNNESEAAFKLAAQAKIEKSFINAECRIERIGFKGSTELNNNIERWSIEIRYKGDAVCFINTTRALESMQPFIKIDSYNANHQGLTSDGTGDFNALLKVSVWFMEEAI